LTAKATLLLQYNFFIAQDAWRSVDYETVSNSMQKCEHHFEIVAFE
jgi:hypothetical protein